MTKIILVRHGHVEGISPERFRGRADLALTPEGCRQAEATARRIEASWAPAALYASPLSRCRTTAETIGRPIGLIPTPVPGLMDIDYGEWQGLTRTRSGANGPRRSTPGTGRRIGRRSPVARACRMCSPAPLRHCATLSGSIRGNRSCWPGTTASTASTGEFIVRSVNGTCHLEEQR